MFFLLKSRKNRTKNHCFDIFTPLLCKNMRSENLVSYIILKGLITVWDIFVDKKRDEKANENRFERYAFSLEATCLIS